jgi:hypothetical protein
MNNDAQKTKEYPHNNAAPPDLPRASELPAISSAHSLPAAAKTSEATPHPESSPELSSVAAARELIPSALRARKFRAHSFAASLSPDQLDKLTNWLVGTDTIPEIQQRIAAPPPHGFGKNVCETTLRRLRAMGNNVDLADWLKQSMEAAEDLLDSDAAGDVAPLRETLSLMLYSRTLYAVQKQGSSAEILRLVNTLAKLEKLGRRAAPRNGSPASAPVTRHIVDLNVSR